MVMGHKLFAPQRLGPFAIAADADMIFVARFRPAVCSTQGVGEGEGVAARTGRSGYPKIWGWVWARA